MDPLTAGIEIGGTKTVVLLARGRQVVAQQRIATTRPDQTLEACRETLTGWRGEHGRPLALGVGSFGPLDRGVGRIARTPKPGWSGVDLVGEFAGLGMPVSLDTDVNAAALAEDRWGAAAGTRVSIYVTIGTGIGAGLIVNGRPVHGLGHPEAGHIPVAARDGFAGICPFHGACLEGLASGPAIMARTGGRAEDLPNDHIVWQHVAAELGDMLAILLLTVAPERIVIGGGVGLGRAELLPAIRQCVVDRLAGYLGSVTTASIAGIVRAAELGGLGGALGAAALPSIGAGARPI